MRQIRNYLSVESTKTLIHAFVPCHLDYCNFLLYGIPQYQCDRLQRVLNAAAGHVSCSSIFTYRTSPCTTSLASNQTQNRI